MVTYLSFDERRGDLWPKGKSANDGLPDSHRLCTCGSRGRFFLVDQEEEVSPEWAQQDPLLNNCGIYLSMETSLLLKVTNCSGNQTR